MYRMLHFVVLVAAAVSASFVVTGASRAAVPPQMNFQGILLDSVGATVPDSSYELTFRLFDADAAGTVLWAETQIVTTDNGLFNSSLGKTNPVPDAVFSDPDRWLELQLVSSPSPYVPRNKLGSVAYAFRTNTVDGATGGTISGDVSIQSNLDVAGDIRATGKATFGPGHTNSGTNAFVAGAGNSATGDLSLAAGTQAKALHHGAFVWADSLPLDFPSTANNQFSARARGGVRFVTGVDALGNPTATAALLPGSGAWSTASDRNIKSDFAPVDGQELLARLDAIPIGSWRYNAQDASVRHIGPTAQDFRSAFGVGEDSLYISTVDANGVALAAIQELHRTTQTLAVQTAKVELLEQQIAELRARLDRLTSVERQ